MCPVAHVSYRVVRAIDLGASLRVDLAGRFPVRAQVSHDRFDRLGVKPGLELGNVLPPEK